MALALATPACTLTGIGLATTIVSTHNELTDSAARWNYTTPILIGASIGLLLDIALIIYLSHAWDKPMT